LKFEVLKDFVQNGSQWLHYQFNVNNLTQNSNMYNSLSIITNLFVLVIKDYKNNIKNKLWIILSNNWFKNSKISNVCNNSLKLVWIF